MLNGDVKNRNPSRKHLFGGLIMVVLFLRSIEACFEVPHGDVKIRHPSRKHISGGDIMCHSIARYLDS